MASDLKKFYITGIYHTATLNDSTLPPIEVYALDRLGALTRMRATVWTEEEWQAAEPLWREECERLAKTQYQGDLPLLDLLTRVSKELNCGHMGPDCQGLKLKEEVEQMIERMKG